MNRRLGERLGLVCGGSRPRFCWLYAPDQAYFVYDRDDRSLLRKSWADQTRPSGQPIGRAWLLAEWRRTRAFDHMGYGTGVRVPVAREYGYAPYFETAQPPDLLPTAELNQNFIRMIDMQLRKSIEFRADSVKLHAEEGRERAEREEEKNKREWVEMARGDWDSATGAFSNLEPGKRDGYFSFLNCETGPEAEARAEARKKERAMAQTSCGSAA